jgi:serine/threonine protein kinase
MSERRVAICDCCRARINHGVHCHVCAVDLCHRCSANVEKLKLIPRHLMSHLVGDFSFAAAPEVSSERKTCGVCKQKLAGTYKHKKSRACYHCFMVETNLNRRLHKTIIEAVQQATKTQAPPKAPAKPVAKPVVPETVLFKVQALFGYQALAPDQLSFEKGDILPVVEIVGGWYKAKNEEGEIGLIPSNYTEKYTGTPALPALPDLPPTPVVQSQTIPSYRPTSSSNTLPHSSSSSNLYSSAGSSSSSSSSPYSSYSSIQSSGGSSASFSQVAPPSLPSEAPPPDTEYTSFKFKPSKTGSGSSSSSGQGASFVNELSNMLGNMNSSGNVQSLRPNRVELEDWEVERGEFDFKRDPTGKRITLGTGGQGSVFVGKWRGQDCAIKEIRMETCEESKFMAEVEFLKKLKHENIYKIIGACKDLEGRMFYILTPTMIGGGLDSKIKKGPLPIETVVKYALGAAKGLEYIHSRKPPIIHRDIKPANILIDEDDNVQLIDFGIAQKEGEANTAGGGAGTARWMSPERNYDVPIKVPAMDVYALGLVIWAMVMGKQIPFEHKKSDVIIIQYVLSLKKVELPWSPDTPPFIVDLVTRCVEVDHTKRPPIETVVHDLSDFKRSGYRTPTNSVVYSTPPFSHQGSQVIGNSGLLPPPPQFCPPGPPVEYQSSQGNINAFNSQGRVYSGHYAPAFAPPPPPPSSVSTPLLTKVNFDFDASEQHQLSIRTGDVVNVLDKNDSGWWFGELRGRRGIFPGNYTTLI